MNGKSFKLISNKLSSKCVLLPCFDKLMWIVIGIKYILSSLQLGKDDFPVNSLNFNLTKELPVVHGNHINEITCI